MNVVVRDVEAVGNIRPMDALLYLRAKGWLRRSASAGRASVWELRRGEEEFEVLLPMNSEFADYAARIADMLGTLALVEVRRCRCTTISA